MEPPGRTVVLIDRPTLVDLAERALATARRRNLTLASTCTEASSPIRRRTRLKRVGGSKFKSELDCSISKETPRGTLAEDSFVGASLRIGVRGKKRRINAGEDALRRLSGNFDQRKWEQEFRQSMATLERE
jgi:hypothetical protein